MDGFTNLAAKANWLKVKFKSPKSFPGDHAVTALCLITGFSYLGRKRLVVALTAVCYGIFLCLPRMVAGAHWLSDVLIGSGSIVTIGFSLAFFSPFASFCISRIERLITPGNRETATA
jgi:membrane-associated phospholipid phosphatase